MGIFAIFFPLISAYIVSRLVTRSKYWMSFVILNIFFIFMSPVILGIFATRSSQFFTILGIMIFYSVVFVPALTVIMRKRRVKYGLQGRWSVPSALGKHKVLYLSSIAFYIYIYVYIWTFGFNIRSSEANILFYIFTGILTLYYMILGFGIAKVGMEEKKKRKESIAGNSSRRIS